MSKLLEPAFLYQLLFYYFLAIAAVGVLRGIFGRSDGCSLPCLAISIAEALLCEALRMYIGRCIPSLIYISVFFCLLAGLCSITLMFRSDTRRAFNIPAGILSMTAALLIWCLGVQ